MICCSALVDHKSVLSFEFNGNIHYLNRKDGKDFGNISS